MIKKVTFNKDAIGQIKALDSDSKVYTFQRGKSIYEINKIHIFDNGNRIVSFKAGHLLDDAGRNEKGRFEGIHFPNELITKHKVDYSQKEAYCVSLGRRQGTLVADLFIPKEALENFKIDTITMKNNVGKFIRVFVEFNGFRVLLKLDYEYDLEKLKIKANKNIKKLSKAINEARTLNELNAVSRDFDLKLYC